RQPGDAGQPDRQHELQPWRKEHAVRGRPGEEEHHRDVGGGLDDAEEGEDHRLGKDVGRHLEVDQALPQVDRFSLTISREAVLAPIQRLKIISKTSVTWAALNGLAAPKTSLPATIPRKGPITGAWKTEKARVGLSLQRRRT